MSIKTDEEKQPSMAPKPAPFYGWSHWLRKEVDQHLRFDPHTGSEAHLRSATAPVVGFPVWQHKAPIYRLIQDQRVANQLVPAGHNWAL